MTRVIGIVSGKGGAGKTTTAINLSLALMNRGKSVTLIDANVNAPNVGLHLGMDFNPVTIEDILSGGAYWPQTIYVHPSGLRIIPANISIDKERVALSELKNHIHKFFGDSDYVVIDCAPGLGEDFSSVVGACDEFLVVTNAEIPAVTDAYRALRSIRKAGGNVLGVVVNKFEGGADDLGIDEMERFFNHRVISIIPHDRNVRRSVQRQNPLMSAKPRSRASRAFKRLAARLENAKHDDIIDKFLDVFGF